MLLFDQREYFVDDVLISAKTTRPNFNEVD